MHSRPNNDVAEKWPHGVTAGIDVAGDHWLSQLGSYTQQHHSSPPAHWRFTNQITIIICSSRSAQFFYLTWGTGSVKFGR